MSGVIVKGMGTVRCAQLASCWVLTLVGQSDGECGVRVLLPGVRRYVRERKWGRERSEGTSQTGNWLGERDIVP